MIQCSRVYLEGNRNKAAVRSSMEVMWWRRSRGGVQPMTVSCCCDAAVNKEMQSGCSVIPRGIHGTVRGPGRHHPEQCP